MRKPKKKNIGSSAVATKGDLEQLREDIHADIAEHTVSKKEFEARMNQMASKKDLERFATKEDLKRFATKDDLKESEKNIISQMKVLLEDQVTEMRSLHEDELDIVAGKIETPPQWKTVPRRLKNVETQVEKIKDHLEIA